MLVQDQQKLQLRPSVTLHAGVATSVSGDTITIDIGQAVLGTVPTIQPKISGYFSTIMNWSNEFKKLKIRTNAETEKDSKVAREFGAEGIGLCRTEHMFFDEERILSVREMIFPKQKKTENQSLKNFCLTKKMILKKFLKLCLDYQSL